MKNLAFIILSVFAFSQSAMAFGYNYISPSEMKTNLENDVPMIILDIQVEEDFNKHYLKGSVATYSYPVKTEEQKQSLETIVSMYNKTKDNIVIVCPRGKGGAKRAYKYLETRNIPEEKLLILEDGMLGWPYKDFVQSI